jgi:hypothetical protein
VEGLALANTSLDFELAGMENKGGCVGGWRWDFCSRCQLFRSWGGATSM